MAHYVSLKIAFKLLFFFFTFSLICSENLPEIERLSNPSINAIFTATDMHKLNRLSQSVVSSDGRFVVYTINKWNENTQKMNSYLEYIELATHKTALLTDSTSNFHDSSPLFSTKFSNTLLFLSDRSGSSQIWFITLPESISNNSLPIATQLTDYPVEIKDFKWSSESGSIIAFSADVFTDCGSDLDCTAKKDKDISKRGPNTYQTYDKLMVRHWDKWLSDKNSNVFIQRVEGGVKPILADSPYNLLLSLNANSPVGPFGSSEMYDIAPDGSFVIFTYAERSVDEAWNTGWKLGLSQIKKIAIDFVSVAEHIKARKTQPKFSVKGNLIAYLAMDREGLESDKLHLEIFDISTSSYMNLTGSIDLTINDYTWENDYSILFTAIDRGSTELFRIDIGSKSYQQISDNSSFNSAPIAIPGSTDFLIERSSFLSPNEVYLYTTVSQDFRQVSNVNPNLKDFQLIKPNSFTFKGAKNEDVQGFLFTPINFDSTRKYPLVLLIHGGPEAAWESAWNYKWNPQLFTNRGYAVVMINPHGSVGMGQNFTDSVRNDWGGAPFQDLMLGVDYVLANNKWLDSNRTCAAGASYGGFMINFIQGNTNRFKCLVSHDGCMSTLSMFYHTEELWFEMAEFCPIDKLGCRAYQQELREGFTKFSPEKFVANWKTPMLVIHGSNDYRVPISEGISVFTALKMRGVPSRFLHFTEENHWTVTPQNSIKWYEEVLNWIDRFNI